MKRVALQIGSRWPWMLSNCAVVVIAFLLTWVCGHRGIFLGDQSLIFDGGWRLLQGQVPYRDILFPFGPITFVIQALFFKLFGVNFSAMVLPAAVLNAVAALLVVQIVKLLLPQRKVTALVAGITTACWFQAPFGTLWFEQTAFFFGLLAFFAGLKAEWMTHARAYGLHVLAGLLLALSVLSKQNAGLLFLPVLLGTIVVSRSRELREMLGRLAAETGGFALGTGGFVLWLWLFSNPSQYFHYSVQITRSLAAARAPENPVLFLAGLLTFSSYAPSIKWCALFFAVPGLVALITGLSRWTESEDRARVSAVTGWIILSCLEFQQLFISVTENEAANGVPFLGLIGGLSLGWLLNTLGMKGFRFYLESSEDSFAAAVSGRMNRAFLAGAAVLLWSALIVQGVRTSWNRSVQQFAVGTHFSETLDVDGLRHLKWADCSYSGRLAISSGFNPPVTNRQWWLRKSDFQELNDWLARNPGNFFVFGDSTILYGLHRRPSPQPWLYFIDGHSYLDSDLTTVDQVVVASLSRVAIRTVIVEKVSWAGNEDAEWLPRMPRLQSWIGTNFVKEMEFGIYEVWVLKSS